MEPLAKLDNRKPDPGRVCPPPTAPHDASEALIRADEARPLKELAWLGELAVCYRDTVLFRTGHSASPTTPFLPCLCDSLPGGFAAVLRQQSDQILALAVRVEFIPDSDGEGGGAEGGDRRPPHRIDKYGRMAMTELLLHRGYHERLFRWVANESDAEDIVQDVVTKLLTRGLGNYSYPHPVAPYLRRVIQNHRTDLARRRQRQAKTAGDLHEQAGPGGPEEEAIRHEVVAAVGSLREELTGDDRRVLDLMLEGTTIQESADRLGWSVSRTYGRRCFVRDLLEARFRDSCVCAVSR